MCGRVACPEGSVVLFRDDPSQASLEGEPDSAIAPYHPLFRAPHAAGFLEEFRARAILEQRGAVRPEAERTQPGGHGESNPGPSGSPPAGGSPAGGGGTPEIWSSTTCFVALAQRHPEQEHVEGSGQPASAATPPPAEVGAAAAPTPNALPSVPLGPDPELAAQSIERPGLASVLAWSVRQQEKKKGKAPVRASKVGYFFFNKPKPLYWIRIRLLFITDPLQFLFYIYNCINDCN